MINLQVRTESGEILVRGSHAIDWDIAQYIDPDVFPCLGGLLPYADTMFNARQVERLRVEVSSRVLRDMLGAEVVSEIERCCLQVENGLHLYLWFLGD
jgi:hypothetical protein